MMKPVSAAISNAAAINWAIRPNPCDVIIAMKRGPTRPRQHPFTLGAALPHVAPLMRATHKTAAPARRKRKRKRKNVCQDEAAATSTIVCV
jgi:hypothetical protein